MEKGRNVTTMRSRFNDNEVVMSRGYKVVILGGKSRDIMRIES